MNVVPCRQNDGLRKQIEEFAETLKTEAHRLGDHGLSEAEFYNSGLFRGAIERIRGQYSATMKEKRDFARRILDHMRDTGCIRDWESAGEANRHDYSVHLNSGRIAAIELKGCLDGNNTNIFERPPQAQEFVIWSVCSNPGADPQHNAWSGIHTRLSAEIVFREQRVDGLIIWDMVCGTIGRPCPKTQHAPHRLIDVGPYRLPPPCIYVFPATVPSPRNNPHPPAQRLEEVELLAAFNACFHGDDSEINYVDFMVQYRDADMLRTTRIVRNGAILRESAPTPIRRA
ncbi:MAG TPA: hypothetical protein VJ001_16130 [Rhodocyclaceae bacterium]|nr:hypothetical protein [Rhodocyclaceae bacterium]